MRRRLLTLAAASACLAPTVRAATPWPTRQVRIVVTFPPGGSSDIVARVLAELLGRRTGQTFVVDNRAGAGGTLAAAHVAAQPADGATLMLSNTAPIVTSPPLYPALAYDPVGGFSHVAYLGATPMVVLANPDRVKATDLAGLVAWAKEQSAPPGYGTSGLGSVQHILGETLAARTGVALLHVPYRGSGPMLADLLGGAIPLAFDALPQNVENIRSGRLRALAVTAPSRQPMAPEVPTTAEAGFPWLLAENWLGVSTPAGLPEPVRARIHEEVAAVLALPAMQERLRSVGIVSRPMTQAEFAAFVAEQVREIGGAVRALGITAQ